MFKFQLCCTTAVREALVSRINRPVFKFQIDCTIVPMAIVIEHRKGTESDYISTCNEKRPLLLYLVGNLHYVVIDMIITQHSSSCAT